jgi:Asp-tRNA(Asn)/Glu-tRNA(Gln) amidotransferase A subunit family amidase
MSPRWRYAPSSRHSWARMTPPRGLADVARALAAGKTTPLEVLDACLANLDRAQAHGAFVHVDPEGARRAARNPPAGPLHGVPVAVKDLIDVAGMPTALGRAEGRIATRDAAIVARLRQAGAVIVGKTRTDELGLGAITPGATNPRDPQRSPGGSSGGSAIAVATGAALLALATDTAGSARIPAAACGVSGLCAAAGWMPTDGVCALAPTFDRLGLIAATPQDLAVAWTALGGEIGRPPQRVVTLADDQLGRVEPEYLEAARVAARQLSPAAIELSAPSLPQFGPPRATVITAEAAARHHGETPTARAQLDAGGTHTPEAVRSARSELKRLGDELRDAVGDGVLVLPALPSPPPRWDELDDIDAQLRATGRLTRLCGPVNSSGLVAASSGAVQFVGRDVGTALAAAHRHRL